MWGGKGNYLVEREGYKTHTDMEAVYFYLVHKFSWPLAQVRECPMRTIRFVLSEEMEDWTAPVEAR